MDPAKIALDPVRIRIQFLPRIRPDPDPDPAPSLVNIIELPICQQKWLDIGNSMHLLSMNTKYFFKKYLSTFN